MDLDDLVLTFGRKSTEERFEFVSRLREHRASNNNPPEKEKKTKKTKELDLALTVLNLKEDQLELLRELIK
jgi:hypothetical protein